jgi:ribonucleotide reductase beta subunit family protein with ferritin-like domain
MVSSTFRQVIVLSSRVKMSERSDIIKLFFLDWLAHKTGSVRFSETSENSHPATQHHSMEDLKFQKQDVEIIRPRLTF